MPKKFIAGNWKLNPADGEKAIELCQKLRSTLEPYTNVRIAVCPPFVGLGMIAEYFKDTNIQIGAQNLFWEDTGAYTGEVSGSMIKSTGCDYVIIGHSERRQYFGETNETVHKKIEAALRNCLIPIICVGETLEERESGKLKDVVREQVVKALSGIEADLAGNIVIAYEPVWAIGTGVVATPEQAEEMHKFIRQLLADNFSEGLAKVTPILYGGSMKPDNARELLSQPDIDGGLIGGASLNAESFTTIVEIAEKLT